MTKKRKRPNKSHCPLGGGANPCGWCRLHHATLTVRQMKNRACLQKGCHYFVRYSDHGYWVTRENTRSKRTNASAEFPIVNTLENTTN